MSTDVRSTFTTAGRWFVELVDRIPPTSWGGPGLGDWDLLSLVGHTSRSFSTVISYLQRPVPEEQVPSATAYYEVVRRLIAADPAAVTDRGRQAGLALGDHPELAVRTLLDEAVAALDSVGDDPVIETIAGGMHLSAYLPTRTFELTVHGLDIAAACRIGVPAPAPALRAALELAADLARLHGEGEDVLLALTGRRPLPADYSVL